MKSLLLLDPLMIYQQMFWGEETATAAIQFLDEVESRCRFGYKSSLLFQRPSPVLSKKKGSHHTAASKTCYSSNRWSVVNSKSSVFISWLVLIVLAPVRGRKVFRNYHCQVYWLFLWTSTYLLTGNVMDHMFTRSGNVTI